MSVGVRASGPPLAEMRMASISRVPSSRRAMSYGSRADSGLLREVVVWSVADDDEPFKTVVGRRRVFHEIED